MMYILLLVTMIGVACANPLEKRIGTEAVAEARDTSSSYAAPAAHAAPAAAQTYDTGSQGNLYYYYYPVEEYGETGATGGDFDIFTAIILPLLILGGLLLLLSSLTFTLTGNGRSLTDEPDMMDQLHTEIERVFYIYLNAFESEQCLQRTICEMGIYSKDFKGKDFVLSMVEPLVPEGMKGNMAIFKKAAHAGYETGKCKKFRCIAPKLL